MQKDTAFSSLFVNYFTQNFILCQHFMVSRPHTRAPTVQIYLKHTLSKCKGLKFSLQKQKVRLPKQPHKKRKLR